MNVLRIKQISFILIATFVGWLLINAYNSNQVQYYEILNLLTKIEFPPTGNMNGALIRNPYETGYLLAFHKDYDLYHTPVHYNTKINILKLNANFLPENNSVIDLNQSYNFPSNHQSNSSTAQDPRFIYLHDKLYLLFNDAVTQRYKREMYLAELRHNQTNFTIKNITHLYYLPAAKYDQKNWTPLIYDQKLYLINNIDPFVLLAFNAEKNELKPLYINKKPGLQKKWPYGKIRGGTPAIYVKELDGYLAFFHSSVQYKEDEPPWIIRQGPPWRKYYIGAIVFDSKPPFHIKSYTGKPLTYPGLYNETDSNYQIIFPSGLIDDKQRFIISAGFQDSMTVILSVDKDLLFSKLRKL